MSAVHEKQSNKTMLLAVVTKEDICMRLIFILTKRKKAELGIGETVVLDLSKTFKNTRILLNPPTTYPLTTDPPTTDHLSIDPPTH